MKMIDSKSLTKVFGNIKAVNNLTFSVNKGEIFGLVGPDGAGKTTTMRLLSAILDPTSGTAEVNGKDIRHDGEGVKEDIGYMSQKFGLYQDLTVLENLIFYADIFGLSRDEKEKKIKLLLEFSQLTPFKDRLAEHLSGGMKQKLGLSCALIHTPKVLFLDEPTSGVDPISRQEFWQILYQLLKEDVTILISTAYMDEADRCHRVGFLHEGSLIAEGTSAEIKQRIQGQLFQLRSERPREEIKLLQDALSGDTIALFGKRIHLLTKNSPRALSFVRENLPHVEIQPIEPSLEDAFIALLRS